MKSLIPGLLFLFLISCSHEKTSIVNPLYSPEIEAKIKRITDNIKAESQFFNQYKTSSLKERMAYYQTPGLSIAVINNGEIEWARGFGIKDINTKEAVDQNTLFQAASISKALVSLAIMKLKENKEIDIDRDVNQYLKTWKIPANNGWQPVITLRQLLSHTAGLTVSGFEGYSPGAEIPSTVQVLKGEYPANSEPVIANIIPGTRFRYSGGGVTVAQLVLEEKFNKPLYKIMDSLLISPLNLTYSSYEQPIPELKEHMAASGYEANLQPLKGKHNVYPEMAAAGLWTNPSELAKIVLEIQKACKGESDFINAESVNEMLTPQKVEQGMGIGLFLEGQGENLLFGHSGGNMGFQSQMYGYKNNGKGAVIMINSSGYQAFNSNFRLVFEVLRAIAIEYNWPDYFKENKKFPVKEETLNAFCGNYLSEEGWAIKITQDQSGLSLEMLSQPPVYLLAESDTRFYCEDLNIKVEFLKSGLKVDKLEIQQDWWKKIVATRINYVRINK